VRVYTVHVPQRPLGTKGGRDLRAAVAATVAVKDGFSWPAFFFSFLWALTQRLWVVALALFAAELALSVATEMLDLTTTVALSFGAMVIFGWLGNDLKRRGLARRGLAEQGVVLAYSGEEAVRRYFAEMAPRDGYVA
jgi:hypothetical protein